MDPSVPTITLPARGLGRRARNIGLTTCPQAIIRRPSNARVEIIGPPSTRRLERPCILIVDDDPSCSSYLEVLLTETWAFEAVAVARDGYEAGFKVASFHPTIILLDLLMPGIDGFVVCRDLKANPLTSHVSVIAMTGSPTREAVLKIRAAGAMECLPKPIDTSDLRNAIGKAVDQLLGP